jgi:transposase
MAKKGRRSSYEERVNAIRLLQRGYTRTEVADILGVATSSVYDWQGKYRKGGLGALSTKMAPGREKLLTDAQLLRLYMWLRGRPRQVRFDVDLWTRKIVRDLIRREFGIDYSLQNVGKILKMLGCAPQRPIWRALEHDLGKRRQWFEETFPAIKKRGGQEGAKIYFADESYSRTDHDIGTTGALGGHALVPEEIGTCERIGLISAMGMRGEMHWMIYTESMSSALFTDYLGYLIQDVQGKVFLIADQAKYHTSQETAQWVKEHDRIELFFLPRELLIALVAPKVRHSVIHRRPRLVVDEAALAAVLDAEPRG